MAEPFLTIVVDENGVHVLGADNSRWQPERWLIKLGIRDGHGGMIVLEGETQEPANAK